MSRLKVHNSLTRQLEEFKPIEEGKVKIYVCGPTVYDHAHLGHARCYIIWDVVTRYLAFRGYELQYVRNITDVDDKIINRAKANNTTPKAVTKQFIKEFTDDMASINVNTPNIEPKATEYIGEMIKFTKTLVDKGHAYAVDGDVYFRVNSYKNYGQLAHQKLEDLMSGARVEADSRKESPLDFALWKSIEDETEIHWNSPWGKGRPGWHTECCAMINKLMGETIDIHAGGLDLAFPHHENEKAQAECFTGKKFVNYWLHNGFVNVESEKMSKSLDNFKTIKDLAHKYDSNTIRLFILTNHYRMPVDFRNEALTSAKQGIKKIHNALKEANAVISESQVSKDIATDIALKMVDKILSTDQFDNMKEELPEFGDQFCTGDFCSINPWAKKEFSSIAWRIKEFITAMDNDFNTSKAIAILFDIASMIQKNKNAIVHENQMDNDLINIMTLESVILEKLAGVLGFSFDLSKQEFDGDALAADLMQLIIDLRKQARTEKNWALSDMIRDRLKELKIVLKDQKDGKTSWELDE